MANCPKCNYKLKLTDIKPNCPSCGTNLMFYGYEERFYREAKYAEMDLAAFRVWIAKVKAAFIGGKLQIARLCACFLPVAALLMPLGKVIVTLPLFEEKIHISALGVYNLFTGGGLSLLLELQNSELLGDVAKGLIYSLIAFAAAALCAVGILLTQILCFVNLKRSNIALVVFGSLGIVFAAVSLLLAYRIPDMGSMISSSGSAPGLLCHAAAFGLVLGINAALIKKGIEVQYKEGDLYRAQMLKRYKRKEITLDDLPFPVFETEEERLEREKKEKETAEKLKLAQAGGVLNE